MDETEHVYQKIREKLTEAIAAGLLPGWRLGETGPDRPFLRPDHFPDNLDVGVGFHQRYQDRNRGMIRAGAWFPTYDGGYHQAGNALLEKRYIGLGIDRPAGPFVRDLNRRLLVPFLAALPIAQADVDDYKRRHQQQTDLYAALTGIVDPFGVYSSQEGRFSAHIPQSAKSDLSVYVHGEVHQGYGGKYGRPALVDLNLSNLPPAVAAQILNLLGEEATS